VKDAEWLPGSPEAISESYVFVCCHGSRDKRCGVCGPALIKVQGRHKWVGTWWSGGCQSMLTRGRSQVCRECDHFQVWWQGRSDWPLVRTVTDVTLTPHSLCIVRFFFCRSILLLSYNPIHTYYIYYARYGYVVPDDVPVLLHKHIGQGEIVDHLWRYAPWTLAVLISLHHGLRTWMVGMFLHILYILWRRVMND